MKKQAHIDALEKFVEKAGIAPRLVDTGASNQVAQVVGRENVAMKVGAGELAVARLKGITFAAAAGSDPSRKTDGEVADETYAGKTVYYRLFVLNSYGDASGSNGPFYVQLEGAMGVTDLHLLYPFNGGGQWKLFQFADRYVGRMHTLRMAAGTSDGWGIKHVIILNPRGHVWMMPDRWLDTDGAEIFEVNF